MEPLNFLSILKAQRRLRPYLTPTPLESAPALGANVYFKLENVNPTHSFKIRGALNAVLAQQDAVLQRGIVAASAGNHAQGVAYGATLTGADAMIVMPKDAPRRKIDGAERYGATVLLYGDSYDDAEAHARALEQETGRLFISPYNDPYVVAGQGTITLELFEQLPTLRRIIVPTSGGGLLGGIALAAHQIQPDVEIIGVQSVATPAIYNFFYDTHLPQAETLADGLSGEIESGSITLALCKAHADRILLVEEAAIVEAIRWTFVRRGWVIEGAAAVGVAALLERKVDLNDGQPTAVIISGGNIDADKFLRLMQTGHDATAS